MSKLTHYFKDYELYHKTRGNQWMHRLGIPLIVLSVLGLLAHWVVFSNYMDGGVLLLGVGLVWYLYLDWKLGTSFMLVMVGFYFLGRAIPPHIHVGLFVLGWIFQGVGHVVFEKKAPAFAKNLMHLFTGPLWIFAKMVGYI